jgi:heme/copper-type cytochrome/quinol oxidase subunit 3
VTIRSSEVHLYYNLQVFYWHFLESLWLFIFLVLYLAYKWCLGYY